VWLRLPQALPALPTLGLSAWFEWLAGRGKRKERAKGGKRGYYQAGFQGSRSLEYEEYNRDPKDESQGCQVGVRLAEGTAGQSHGSEPQ